MPIVLAFVVLFAIVAVAASSKLSGGAATKGQQQTTIAECDALRAQRDSMSHAGADSNAIDGLNRQIADCITRANALGANIPASLVTLQSADALRTQMESEWNHYKTTYYGDLITRNNTRTHILSIQASQTALYRTAISQATTTDQANAIEQSLLASLNDLYDRKLCFANGSSGCGRFGVDEPDGSSRAADEQAQIDSLIGAYISLGSMINPNEERAVPGYPAKYDIVDIEARQLSSYIADANAKFAEYEGVDWGDQTRRVNTLNDLNAKIATIIVEANNIGDLAISRRVKAEMDNVVSMLNGALGDSNARFAKYSDAGSRAGGRYGFSEALNTEKAAQEAAFNTGLQNARNRIVAAIPAQLDAARFGVVRSSPIVLSGLHIGRAG